MSDDEKAVNATGCQCCNTGSVKRRTVLQGMATVGGMMAVTPAFAQAAEDSMPPQVGDTLTIHDDGRAMTPDDLRPGTSPKTAYAVSPAGVIRKADINNSLLAVRFDDADLTAEAKAAAVEGVLIYSAICTHAGCEVQNWIREEKNLECPCHGSHFDPKNNGAVVFGPASRKLPQLGIALTDGKLTVASGFDSRVGGDETM